MPSRTLMLCVRTGETGVVSEPSTISTKASAALNTGRERGMSKASSNSGYFLPPPAAVPIGAIFFLLGSTNGSQHCFLQPVSAAA